MKRSPGKGSSDGHHMQTKLRRYRKKDVVDVKVRQQRRRTKVQKARPRIISMSIAGHTLIEISTAVGLEPFVVDAILRKEAQ